MVTDGEISPLNEDIKQRLKYAHEERGLEVRAHRHLSTQWTSSQPPYIVPKTRFM
jgi:hypothetical protein